MGKVSPTPNKNRWENFAPLIFLLFLVKTNIEGEKSMYSNSQADKVFNRVDVKKKKEIKYEIHI